MVTIDNNYKIPIEVLNLSPGIIKVLKANSINTITDLELVYHNIANKIIRIKGIGSKTIDLINEKYFKLTNRKLSLNTVRSYLKEVVTMEDDYSESIERFYLPTKIMLLLNRNNIHTINDIEKSGPRKLFKLKGIGPKSLQLIMDEYARITRKSLDRTNIFELNNAPKALVDLDIYIKKLIDENQKYLIILDEISNPNIGHNIVLKSNLNPDNLLDELPLNESLIKLLNSHRIFKVSDICSIPLTELISIIGVDNSTFLSILNVINNEHLNSTINKEEQSILDSIMNRINNSTDKDMVNKRYGLLTGERLTLEEIGREYKLTRERVRQRILRSINRIAQIPKSIKSHVINTIELLILKNDGVISDEEADIKMVDSLKSNVLSGSSVLDLLTDLGWINKIIIGDVILYTPNYIQDLVTIFNIVISYLKNQNYPLSIEEILYKKQISSVPIELCCSSGMMNSKIIFKKFLRLNPHLIESTPGKFMFLKHNNKSVWISAMEKTLKDIGKPMHFIEIANYVNNSHIIKEHLDTRRAHSLLIQESIFANTGSKGIYGLTKWGIRKEPTIDLIAECISNSEYRIHWKQIFLYVSKFKRTTRARVKILLDTSGKFISLGEGAYDIKR